MRKRAMRQHSSAVLAGGWRGAAHERRARGFTLIELLVVIAIIALLVAILLPVLGRAKEQGRRARCGANLHQIALAWTMYLDQETTGVFPPLQNNLHWFYGGKVDRYEFPQRVDVRPVNRWIGLDPSGNPHAEVFHCPNDNGQFPRPVGWTAASSYDYFGNSYPTNPTLLANDRNACLPVRLGEIRLPAAQVVLVGDQQMIYPGSLAMQARWHDAEGLNMNLAFLDGHAQFMHLLPDVEQTSQYSFAVVWLPPPEDPNKP